MKKHKVKRKSVKAFPDIQTENKEAPGNVDTEAMMNCESSSEYDTELEDTGEFIINTNDFKSFVLFIVDFPVHVHHHHHHHYYSFSSSSSSNDFFSISFLILLINHHFV